MRLSLYSTLFLLGFRTELRLFVATMIRSTFLLLLLFIFSRLWALILPDGLSMPQLLWYFLITELIIISTPRVYLGMERDISDGTFAVLIQKPINYATTRIAESLGVLLGRLPSFVTLGATGTLFFTGEVPAGLRSPFALIIAFLLIYLAASVLTISYAIIGLCSAFLRDTRTLSMVWDKGVWLLGGLMVPIILYPPWLQQIAPWTPFYYLLFGVAQIALNGVSVVCIHTAIALCLWGAFGMVLVGLLQRKIASDIIGEGG